MKEDLIVEGGDKTPLGLSATPDAFFFGSRPF